MAITETEVVEEVAIPDAFDAENGTIGYILGIRNVDGKKQVVADSPVNWDLNISLTLPSTQGIQISQNGTNDPIIVTVFDDFDSDCTATYVGVGRFNLEFDSGELFPDLSWYTKLVSQTMVPVQVNTNGVYELKGYLGFNLTSSIENFAIEMFTLDENGNLADDILHKQYFEFKFVP